MTMEISYKLDNFEGPLDLLLKLIEKNKVSIFDIPIEMITDQYLEYVRQMPQEDLDLLSDFLVMAATLLAIKSKMLLPAEKKEEEEGDPREELVRRLLEYKMYKYISQELRLYELNSEDRFYRAPTVPKKVQQYEAPIDLDKLLAGITAERLKHVFQTVMRRQQQSIDPIRSKFGTIRKEPVSLEDTVKRVLRYARKRRNFKFSQVIAEDHDRIHVVVSFLALLELMKIGKIRLVQENLFDEMDIETIEPEGETDDLDLEELSDFDGE